MDNLRWAYKCQLLHTHIIDSVLLLWNGSVALGQALQENCGSAQFTWYHWHTGGKGNHWEEPYTENINTTIVEGKILEKHKYYYCRGKEFIFVSKT